MSIRSFLGAFFSVVILTVGYAAPLESSEIKPLKVAVFVGEGARNIGAFRWLEIATMAENVSATPVDGAAVRAGALDSADVLIMPGGGAATEAKELGEVGREKVKAFIRSGGGYIGTCAGFYLVTEPTGGRRKNYLGLIPFRDTNDGGNGKAEVMFAFNDLAEKLAGIKKGKKKHKYSQGPVPVRSKTEIEGTKAEVLATFACDYNPRSTPSISKAGHPAVVAAECGKGKIFVFVAHPEVDVDDHSCIEGAFRYVSGREIKWRYPQRKRGQLAVGFVCDNSFGPNTAKVIQQLLRDGEFDIVPVNGTNIGEGALRHLDAVLVPDCADKGDKKAGIYGMNTERTKAFIARGGRVIAWGSAAECANKLGINGISSVADAKSALSELRTLAATNVTTSATILKKVEKPVKVAVFADNGCGMGNIPLLLEISPEYDVTIVGAKEVAAGELKKFDMLYMPGGYSSVAYNTLGEDGRKAIVDYIRGGGHYYGVCGGAFLISQTPVGKSAKAEPGTKFLGVLPFKDDKPHHYRGKAPVRISLTDEGKKVFPKSDEKRIVWYAGGPAFIDADKVDDSELEVFVKYDTRVISTLDPRPTPDMTGKAAIVGGRVGKGKVYAQCPHPEFHERNFDMVRDSFEWLAGVRPTGVLPHREKGALSVLVKLGYRKGMNDAVKFYVKTILEDRRFDSRPLSSMNNNELAHADAVVLCLFDKNSWTPKLKEFVKRGGKVVVVAETEKKQTIAQKFDGAAVVDSYDKVAAELLK